MTRVSSSVAGEKRGFARIAFSSVEDRINSKGRKKRFCAFCMNTLCARG